MSFSENMNLTKNCFEQVYNEILPIIGGYLGRRYTEFHYSNMNDDMINKIDAWATYERNPGDNFQVSIQFRAFHTFQNSYLPVRVQSWSKTLNKMVPSEFYVGNKINFFIMMWYDDNYQVVDYFVVDWNKLFPKFNKEIFIWNDRYKVGLSSEHQFYYVTQMKSGDNIHNNEFINIPIKPYNLVDKRDKSIETHFPECIVIPSKH